MFTSTATASGLASMAWRTCSVSMPREIPSLLFTSGFTYTGMAPQRIMALMTLLCTFLGRIILSPALQTESTMPCTAEVVPPTIRNAWAAPKASAASSSASRITETGWQRLSRGFMEFTSSPTHRSPRSCTSSRFPLPLLCPGTSKGTTRCLRNRSSASQMGALF